MGDVKTRATGAAGEVRKPGVPLPALQQPGRSLGSGVLVPGAVRLIVLPVCSGCLPALKSCLVLVASDCGKPSRSKTLSNSAAEPKSHFPHGAARGFSRQLGRARGSPDLIKAIHALSPARICLSAWQME